MIASGLHGRILFWLGAVGLAVFLTAGLVVLWFTVVGISVPPGEIIADAWCTINVDWTAVVPFAVAALVCFFGMIAGRLMNVRSRRLRESSFSLPEDQQGVCACVSEHGPGAHSQ